MSSSEIKLYKINENQVSEQLKTSDPEYIEFRDVMNKISNNALKIILSTENRYVSIGMKNKFSFEIEDSLKELISMFDKKNIYYEGKFHIYEDDMDIVISNYLPREIKVYFYDYPDYFSDDDYCSCCRD